MLAVQRRMQGGDAERSTLRSRYHESCYPSWRGAGFPVNKTAHTHKNIFWGGSDFTAAHAADPKRAVGYAASKDGCRGRNPGCFG
jgi:hypothetical protein